jgi:DNA-binding response OmpR family regulator
LIAEADPSLGKGLRDFFQMEDYRVRFVQEGHQAFEELTSADPYDAGIIGVQLPNKEGFSVLREARQQGVDTPVIFLTALSGLDHKLRAFQLGAADCVTKPFDIDELSARVSAAVHREKPVRSGGPVDYSFSEYTVHFPSQTISKNGKPLDLTDTEFKVLERLIHARGRPVPRERLLREILELGGRVQARGLDAQITSLRRKIEPNPETPSYIQTVFGVGYKFTG